MVKHEGIILELPDWAEWLARDKNDSLWAYEGEPKKERIVWNVDGLTRVGSNEVKETDDTFESIRWEDEKPTRIKDFIASMKKEAEPLNVVTNDMVDRPTHYKDKNGKDLYEKWHEEHDIQTFRAIMRAVAERYTSRYEKKNGIEDLKKGIYTLERLREYEEREAE